MIDIMGKYLRTSFAHCVLLTILMTLTSCSLFFGGGNSASLQEEPELSSNLLQSGSIVIASPVPKVSSPSPIKMLGFLPTEESSKVFWLSIDRSSQKVTLMQGQKALSTSEADGIDLIPAGSYSVVHKQKSPLWYAPDSYFTARGLPLPPQGDRSRLRRGALGSMALFLDNQTPIHSGSLWTAEVGGARVNEDAISEMYQHLGLGAQIHVE